MDRKTQLQELIEANKKMQKEAEVSCKEYTKELGEISEKESLRENPEIRALKKKLELSPRAHKDRMELTRRAIEAGQGNFVVWRGGQGAPPESQFVEIEQPILNSENVLFKAPFVKQHFQVLAVTDTLDDLKYMLEFQPDGLITLPQRGLYYFSEFIPNQPAQRKIRKIGARRAPEQTCQYYAPLYDVNTVATSGTSQLNYFQVPLGGCGHGSIPKTQCETNMDQGGSLPYPKTFDITGISIIPCASASYDDAARIVDGSWFRLFIGTMDYFVSPTLPLACLPGKRSPGVNFRLNNPLRPVFCFPEPIRLISQQNFRCEINFPFSMEISKPVKLQVILHGYFYRELSQV